MILITGIPNAGKTTYSKRYENVIHFDDIPHRFTNEQYALANAIALCHGKDAVIEGVYTTAERRKQLLDAFKDIDCVKTCIWLDTSVDECVRRERNFRKRPDSLVTRTAKKFEEPSLSEGWSEILIIKEGDIPNV